MYSQGHWQYDVQVKKFGHPSKVGFKDVIHQWKAEKWDPDHLIQLYKKAGAKYFMALANHHDNFDLYASSYQPWNSTKIGPMKDLIAGWEKAARKHGLKFGVSVHAAHAWSWMEPSQGSDKTGPLAGVPYDGKLTKADGKGTWWEGLDPQDLYAQNHAPSPNFEDLGSIHARWDWGNGQVPPSKEYCEKFLKRTIELVDNYKPDLIYFDDSVLPLYPVSDVGLTIASHFYNVTSGSKGNVNGVLFGKVLSDAQKKSMVWDIERGQSNSIETLPFQTCTCIGGWHYDRGIFERHEYRGAKAVIHQLADVVSKNGNLLLSVPVRADGTIDEDETKIVEQIGEWMSIYGDAIYGTRPWKVFGEGPAIAGAKPIQAQGFNEGSGKAATEDDWRFTTKKGAVYAINLGKPTKTLQITSLGTNAKLAEKAVKSVTLLGSREKLTWKQTPEALVIEPPKNAKSEIGFALRIQFK